jgi:hypothetical protein
MSCVTKPYLRRPSGRLAGKKLEEEQNKGILGLGVSRSKE